MDYLVFGVGFGSSLVLVGWLHRQYGPLLRFRDSTDDVLSAEQLLERNDWQRFCVALGALLSVSGAVMLLATLVTMLIHPSDSVGTIIVGIIFSLSLIGVVVWIIIYVNQHRALAGDRREEVTAATAVPRVRKAAAPAAAQGSDRIARDGESAAPTPPAQDQKRAPEQPRATTGAPTRATPSPAATRSSERREAPRDVKNADVQPVPARTPAPAATQKPVTDVGTSEAATGAAAPALRSLQFKRTAANRAQQERKATPAHPRSPGDDDVAEGLD